MSDFSLYITEWQPFYYTLSGVSATMAGLLFTSLSLNPRLLSNDYLKTVAQQAFLNFSFLLLLGLILLQPRQQPLPLSLSLTALGAVAFMRLLIVLAHLRKDGVTQKNNVPWAARLMRLSQIAFVLLLPIAGLIYEGNFEALRLMQAIMIALLMGTGKLCWELLLHGKQGQEEPGLNA